MESSLCEKPERHASRRLSDHLTLEDQKQKVHSLMDKVYSRENLKLAWMSMPARIRRFLLMYRLMADLGSSFQIVQVVHRRDPPPERSGREVPGQSLVEDGPGKL